MSKLLRANMVRLWKNKVFWLGFLLLTAFGAVQRITMSMDIETHHLEETFWIVALLFLSACLLVLNLKMARLETKSF